jgi:hypothetical protein
MGRNNDDFKEQIYYHGSPKEFNPGDKILPPVVTGVLASADPQKVYASKDHYVAKFMAWEQNNANGNNFDSEKFPEGTKPPEHVYRVTPLDPTERLEPHSSLTHVPRPDLPWGYGRAQDVISRTGFRVLSRVQDPDKVDRLTRQIANKKEKEADARGVDTSASLRSGKIVYAYSDTKAFQQMRRDALMRRAAKKKANKDLIRATRKNRRLSGENPSQSDKP